MKIWIQESRPGELDDLSYDAVHRAIERATSQWLGLIAKGLHPGRRHGDIEALNQLFDLAAEHYEARLIQLRKAVAAAVRGA